MVRGPTRMGRPTRLAGGAKPAALKPAGEIGHGAGLPWIWKRALILSSISGLIRTSSEFERDLQLRNRRRTDDVGGHEWPPRHEGERERCRVKREFLRQGQIGVDRCLDTRFLIALTALEQGRPRARRSRAALIFSRQIALAQG